MKDLYLAVYSYGPMKLSPLEMAETAKALGFQGLEYLSPLSNEHADALRSTGMKVLDTAEGPSEDGKLSDIDLLHALGVQYVSGTNLVAFGNHQQALWAAERLNKVGKILHREGLKLYYHNHTHEWRKDQGAYLLDTLLQNTDPNWVCLQMDAGWAACAGVDPKAFVEKYPGRVELMHVKASTGVLGPEGVSFMAPPADGDGSFHLAPPAGGADAPAGPPPVPDPKMAEIMANIKSVSGAMKDCIIDYKALMTVAEQNGCKAFIIERDEQYMPDPVGCIREDVEYLRRFW